ncbi:MAG TPA: HAD-IA family hydrolase [Candidatus Limnocylindria bacterium]|nr:HAD-IA family hydrolase [Candidatus Limnocylindria bacterium]
MNRLAVTGIQAVTFDVGGTLIEPWPSVGDLYAETAEAVLGERFAPALLNERFVTAWREAHRLPGGFNYTQDDWAGVVRQTFTGLTPRAGEAELFRALWTRFTEPEAWHVFPDVRPCLETLAASGVRLAVLSNWDERLGPLLERLGLTRHFEVVVVSVEAGTHKPSPAIFTHAARLIGLPPAALLHVGDSAREDFEGARACGWSSLLLRRGTASENAISSLAELPGRLGIS